jgi:hypothetical protein
MEENREKVMLKPEQTEKFKKKITDRKLINKLKCAVKIGEIKMMNADCILHAALEDDKEMV